MNIIQKQLVSGNIRRDSIIDMIGFNKKAPTPVSVPKADRLVKL